MGNGRCGISILVFLVLELDVGLEFELFDQVVDVELVLVVELEFELFGRKLGLDVELALPSRSSQL